MARLLYYYYHSSGLLLSIVFLCYICTECVGEVQSKFLIIILIIIQDLNWGRKQFEIQYIEIDLNS